MSRFRSPFLRTFVCFSAWLLLPGCSAEVQQDQTGVDESDIIARKAAAKTSPSEGFEMARGGEEGTLRAIVEAEGASPTGASTTGLLDSSDGRLPNGVFFEKWAYDGKEKERLDAKLSSLDFDAYLGLIGPDGTVLAEDDDLGGGTNARIVAKLPADGTYYLVVASFSPGETGRFRLDIADWSTRYPGGGDPDGRYALLVGAGDYPEALNAAGVSDLRSPRYDVQAMRMLLIEEYGFEPRNIITLVDRDAYRENVAQAFLRHLGQAGPSGVAVFYYSGHGDQLPNRLGSDFEIDGQDEAIFMWGYGEPGGTQTGFLRDDEIGFLAKTVRAGNLLIILDSCFSGTGTRAASDTLMKRLRIEHLGDDLIASPVSYYAPDEEEARGLEAGESNEAVEMIPEPTRHLLLAASSDSELSWAGSPSDASAFTHFLVQELRGAGGNETFDTVMRDVIRSTVDYTSENFRQQTPQLEGTQSGRRVSDFLQGG